MKKITYNLKKNCFCERTAGIYQIQGYEIVVGSIVIEQMEVLWSPSF